ncbi:hypothetical protein EIP86_001203 [Pleurotus ostreatoroseus]|nr:hypothetical protein EIP86_001203 [Pleurotus ostreatoroseus]
MIAAGTTTELPLPAFAEEERWGGCGCVRPEGDVDCGTDDGSVGIRRKKERATMRVPRWGECQVKEGIDATDDEEGRVEDKGPIERKAIDICHIFEVEAPCLDWVAVLEVVDLDEKVV